MIDSARPPIATAFRGFANADASGRLSVWQWLSQAVHPSLWPLALALAAYAVVYLQHALTLLAFPFDVDQGEGFDAWGAWLIDRGLAMYTDNQAPDFYSTSYPPVWSYLVSIPMAWLGPGLGPARFVSVLATLGCVLLLFQAARRIAGGSRLAGLLAAGFFLASPYVFHTSALARVNSTTLLFSLAAVSLAEVPTRRRALGISLALLLALFSKPSAVDAAAAALGALVLVRPWLAVGSGLLLGVMGLIGLGLLHVLTQGAFWLNVVQSKYVIPTLVYQLPAYVLNLVETHGVVLALAAGESVWQWRRGVRSPWVLYLLSSLVFAAPAVAKSGSGESYFLPTVAAAAVLGSAGLVRLVRALRRAPIPPIRRQQAFVALGTLLVLQAALMSHGPLAAAVGLLPDRGFQATLLGTPPSAGDVAAGNQLVERIRAVSGPVLSEVPSFVVLAGKPIIANAAHLRDLHRGGLWDPTALVKEIDARRYDLVILNAEQYPEPVLVAIGRSYYFDEEIVVSGSRYRVFLPGSE